MMSRYSFAIKKSVSERKKLGTLPWYHFSYFKKLENRNEKYFIWTRTSRSEHTLNKTWTLSKNILS